ncbi:MAG: hypothetical protein ACOY3I_09660 [Verrucomicrobiota bacterium]
MQEEALIQKASAHALPLVQADPLLLSLTHSILKQQTSRAALASHTYTDMGRAITEYYIDLLASKQRISQRPAQQEDPQAFDNLLRLSDLTKEECNFLIQTRIQKWETYID